MTTFNGIISFTINAAKNLPDKDNALFNLDGVTDPYVSIVIDSEKKFETKYIDDDLNPIWKSDNTYEHPVDGEITEISLLVKDKDVLGSEKVGGVHFDCEDLKDFALRKRKEGWFDLRTDDGKGDAVPNAQLDIIMEYKPKRKGNIFNLNFNHMATLSIIAAFLHYYNKIVILC